MACCIFFGVIFSAIASRFPPLRYFWNKQLRKQHDAVTWHRDDTHDNT